MPKKMRILIHYTHKETLGHTTRINALCHELIQKVHPSPRIFILQNDTPQSYAAFPSTTHVLNIPTSSSVQEQSRSILKAAQQIKPDIFITEFFPLGRIEQLPKLLPALHYLRRAGTRIYASAGYPYLVDLPRLGVARFQKEVFPVIGLYDKILIHTPRLSENDHFKTTLPSIELRSFHDTFFKAISPKTAYTGYIMPRHEKAPPDIRSLVMRQKGRTTVIVSRGGGAFFPKIIAHAIQAQKILGPDYRFIIAAGPSTSKNEKRLFDALLARSDRTAIFLFDHIPHLGDLFEHADISVSMCGYNTSMQLLTSNIPSVIIPNPDNDQQARALWLKQYLKSSVLPYNKMTPRSLARAIRTVSSEPDPKIRMPKGWLNGLATTRKLILSDMAKTPSTR